MRAEIYEVDAGHWLLRSHVSRAHVATALRSDHERAGDVSVGGYHLLDVVHLDDELAVVGSAACEPVGGGGSLVATEVGIVRRDVALEMHSRAGWAARGRHREALRVVLRVCR